MQGSANETDLRGLHWRNMTNADLPGVNAMAQLVHVELPEQPEIFAERLALFPQGCRVLASETKKVLGYAISHPIRPFEPPQLDSMLEAIGADATQYYIHDLAIDQRLRGQGYASPVIEQLFAQAVAYSSIGLVSVYGTARFWGRYGFTQAAEDMREKLAPYGEGAIFMTSNPH